MRKRAPLKSGCKVVVLTKLFFNFGKLRIFESYQQFYETDLKLKSS